MTVLGWIVLGLAVGAIAKVTLLRRQGGGVIVVMILGVVGALLGGFMSGAALHIAIDGFFEARTWALAVAGAILVLLAYGALTRGSRRGNQHGSRHG